MSCNLTQRGGNHTPYRTKCCPHIWNAIAGRKLATQLVRPLVKRDHQFGQAWISPELHITIIGKPEKPCGFWMIHHVVCAPISVLLIIAQSSAQFSRYSSQHIVFRVMVQRIEMSATLYITALQSDDAGMYEDTTNDGWESGTIRLMLYGEISESAFIVNVIHVIWPDIHPCTLLPWLLRVSGEVRLCACITRVNCVVV